MRIMRPLRLSALLLSAALAVAASAVPAGGQQRGRGPGGMMGDPAHQADMQVFHALLERRESITRTVTALDNGVDTLTESTDPAVASLLQTHVAAMVARVEQARPIHQRDPLFREIFRHASKIEVRVEHTARGVRVIETSTDPYVVRLIKAHAEVVDRFIANGHAEMMRDHPVPGPVPEPASEAAAPAAGHVH